MATMQTKAGNGVTLARRVLPDVSQELAAMRAEIEALRAQNAQLAAAKPQAKIWCKLSEKGAMSIYGLGRFPFTFYRSQWEAFERALPMIKAWFESNKAQMTTKD